MEFAFAMAAILIILIAIKIWSLVKSHLNKRFLFKMRELVIGEIKSSGFKSTQKYKIGHVLLAVDESRKEWLVLDDYNPTFCIHKFSEIKSIKVRKETTTVTNRNSIYSGKGYFRHGYSTSRSNKVYKSIGIVVELPDLSYPTEYIDCTDSPSSVEKIESIIKTLKSLA